MASNVIRVVNLGRMDYLRTLRIQHQLADRLKADRQREQPASNVLILVEHPPVYTTGIRTKASRRKSALGMKWYVNTLEEIVIQVCKNFNIQASRSPHTGVWVGDNKICAMGVHSSQLITTHGLALNCCTDMKWFDHIVPCGILGKGVTSLSREVGRRVSPEEAAPHILTAFSTALAATMQLLTPHEMAELLAASALATTLSNAT